MTRGANLINFPTRARAAVVENEVSFPFLTSKEVPPDLGGRGPRGRGLDPTKSARRARTDERCRSSDWQHDRVLAASAEERQRHSGTDVLLSDLKRASASEK